jgi:hypothetical protein
VARLFRLPPALRHIAVLFPLLLLACTPALHLPAQLGPLNGRRTLSARDFASIQDALDSLPDEGGTVVVPAGVYTLAKKIKLASNVELRGEGMQETVLVLADGANDHLISNSSLIKGNTDITIRDIGLRGNSAHQSDWSFGVRLTNVTHSLVVNVESVDFWTDGFYLGYNAFNGARNIRVSGCRAANNRRYGLAIKHGTGVLVDGCTFEGNGFAGEGAAVKLGPDQERQAIGNRIIGNRAVGNYSGFVLFEALGYGSRVVDNVLCKNDAEGNATVGFQDFRGEGNLFFDNIAQGNGQDFDFAPTTRTEPGPSDACTVPPLPPSS